MPSDSPLSRLRFPCLMGIVNITPDSFSDGGQCLDPDAAARHARVMVEQGTQILDLGAEASSFFRPGIEPVPPADQLRRLLPVLERLGNLREDVLVSVDTRSSEVARAALGTGANIINDISAGTHDPNLLRVVAEQNAAIILMHMGKEFPATPAQDDSDIVGSVRRELADRHAAATRAGIREDRIALDPGIGFGKTMADNWRLALRAQELVPPGLSCPVVLGASRKRFLETQPPADTRLPTSWNATIGSLKKGEADHARDPASAAITAVAAMNGVAIHRVHNVALAKQALALARQSD